MNELSLPDALWELPTCPQIARRIVNLAPLGKGSVPEILSVIRWDPTISVRILAAANGTKAGQSQPVGSLRHASCVLNDFTIRLLSLQFTLDSLAPETEHFRSLYDIQWRQSWVHAVTAQMLAPQGFDEDNVDPFLAGLLLGLDRLYCLQTNPAQFVSILNTVVQTARPWNAVQRECPTDPIEHPLHLANMPPALGHAVRAYQIQHPQPNVTCPRWERLFAIAEAMADSLILGEINPGRALEWRDRLNEQFASYCSENRVNAGTLESLVDSVRNQIMESLPEDEQLSNPVSILSQANRELARLASSSHKALRKTKSRVQKTERTMLRLKQDALRDPLTGVYNRRFLGEALRKEVARCRRHQASVGLLFVDVDGFKSLNDAWGHQAGDMVLVRIAETLSGTLRQADILARYGGEEFVILPMDATEIGIVQLAERLRSAVEQLDIQMEGNRIPVTISVGCALAVPTSTDDDFDTRLLASADAAMYEAKRLGGNRIGFHSI